MERVSGRMARLPGGRENSREEVWYGPSWGGGVGPRQMSMEDDMDMLRCCVVMLGWVF